MGFLSGSSTFQRYWVEGESVSLNEEHLETLQNLAIDRASAPTPEEPSVGFLAGEHLLDLSFDWGKNVVDDALHFGVRIDTNQVPSAIRRAWLQLELAQLTADSPGSRPTKAQRQEANEAVEARCADEAATGRFRRMQQVPMLWDTRQGILYVGSSSSEANRLCIELMEQAFEREFDWITSSKLAAAFAAEHDRDDAFQEVEPAIFHAESTGEIYWWNGQGDNVDYLGNEFMLWLWWYYANNGDTVALGDESEVTFMFARTLGLECPRGEQGKDTLSADSPVQLPEAELAIRSGKLPRRSGLTLVRHDQQFDLALQAETFAVSGAKIRLDEAALREDRVEAIRNLGETLDLLFGTFCDRRLSDAWDDDLGQIRQWLQPSKRASKPAA